MLFSEIPGHLALKAKLIENVNSDRVAHAQLFSGIDGSAPFAMALAFTQYLFCQKKQAADACGDCPSCKRISSLNHPDLHFAFPIRKVKEKPSCDAYLPEWREMLAETKFIELSKWYDLSNVGNSQPIISVDEAKIISKKLSLKSFEGGYKVLIIWHAETINTQTANKLLKLIEEPTPNTLILLITDSYEDLLATITSRTQLVKVNRIDDRSINEFLAEKTDVETANSITAISDGSITRAMSVLDHPESADFYFDHFQNWMRLCYGKDVLETFNWSEEISKLGRVVQKEFLHFCLTMFRNSVVGNYTNMKMVKLGGKERVFLSKFSKFINHRNIIELSTLFSEAHYHIERNANSKIVFTDLSIKVIRLLRA